MFHVVFSLLAKIKSEVTQMLQVNGNNISEAAPALGVSRNTVYKYSRDLKLQRTER